MRTHQRFLLRLTFIGASALTLLFVLSTIFMFGISTHRWAEADPDWIASSSYADQVQVICYGGQFHLTINFLRPSGFRAQFEPRGWHAGARYSPGLNLNLQ